MNFFLGAFLLPAMVFAHDLELLRASAVDLFTRELGATDGKVIVDPNPRECLRTGYQRSTGKIVFCQSGRAINGGLESVDVINHEMFHALFCGKFPGLCATDEYDHVHEAMADTFAHRLNPDQAFGENFYAHVPFIRRYHTDWIPELVQSEHEQGRALAAKLIREAKPLAEALGLFHEKIPSYVQVEVDGATPSRLNRYRLRPGQVVEFRFRFDPRARVKEVVWELPPGMEENSGISMSEESEGGKAFARFLSEEKKELGRWTFYFGRKL